MKNKSLRRIAAVIIMTLMFAQMGESKACLGSTIAFAATNETTQNSTTAEDSQSQQRQNVSFTDMTYQHYDTAKYYQLIEEIKKLTQDATNSTTVLDKFDQLSDEISTIGYQAELVSLYNSLDVTSQNYADEYTYCYQTMMQMSNDILLVGKAILTSPCATAAKSYWGEDTANYFTDSEVTSKEKTDLLNLEQRLLLKYDTAAKKQYSTTIKGKKYTLEDLYQDATLSQKQYVKAYQSIMKKKNKELGTIYVKLVKLRQQLATMYGYKSYADYCYQMSYSRDYTVEQMANLNKEIKKYIVPVYEKLSENYDYDASNRLDYRFSKTSTEAQCKLMKPYLSQISPALTEAFDYMKKNKLYDIAYSDTKKDEAFTTIITQYNEPFLYQQQGFNFYDMMTLIHEFGHFNGYYTNYLDSNDYSNQDLAEIHSQGLELLYTKFYKKMLGKKDGKAAINYTLNQRLDSIIEGSLYDEFQQEVYALKKPTLDKINAIYTRLCKEYKMIDEDANYTAYGWMDISHNFSSPFYYISYCMSVAPAFELWEESLTDWRGACDKYMKVVSYGESSSYLETLKECGLSSPFETGYFKKLGKTITSYLKLK